MPRAGVDEGGFIDSLRELVEDILRPALFDSHGPLIACSTPPDVPDHPWFDFFATAMLNGFGAIHDPRHALHAGPDRRVCQEIQQETGRGRRQKTIAYRREMMCEHVVDHEKLIVPEFKKEFVMEYRDDPVLPVLPQVRIAGYRRVGHGLDLRVAGALRLSEGLAVR
jgi:hypothetical protein